MDSSTSLQEDRPEMTTSIGNAVDAFQISNGLYVNSRYILFPAARDFSEHLMFYGTVVYNREFGLSWQGVIMLAGVPRTPLLAILPQKALVIRDDQLEEDADNLVIDMYAGGGQALWLLVDSEEPQSNCAFVRASLAESYDRWTIAPYSYWVLVCTFIPGTDAIFWYPLRALIRPPDEGYDSRIITNVLENQAVAGQPLN